MDTTSIDRNSAIYVGVDVHRYTHTAVAANRFEEMLGELTFPNTAPGIGEFLTWLKSVSEVDKPRIIGIEGTNGNGRLLRDLTAPVYPELYEINPVYTKQRRDHGTSGDKSDPVDARLIVEVLTRKLDKLPKVTKQDDSSTMRALEELVIFHDDLVRSQTRLKNQLHQSFHEEDFSYQSRRGASFSNKALQKWQRYLTKSNHTESSDCLVRRIVIKEKLNQFQKLGLTRKKVDREIDRLLPGVNSNLITMPGVGLITAAKIISTTRGIERFKTIDQFIKYAGIAPIERQSGKTKKHKQNKSGNRQLNNAVYTIALTQLRCCPKAKAYFEKKIKEGKTKKHALRCLMKRVACIVYGMLKNGEKYRG